MKVISLIDETCTLGVSVQGILCVFCKGTGKIYVFLLNALKEKSKFRKCQRLYGGQSKNHK